MTWETVIGLETHVELATKTKIFCGCTTAFGGAPNTHCCPVCTGMPGTLPVLNRKVLEFAVKAGLALNCEITRYTKFDRKNYFYPDLPKAYQISQLYLPICRNGAVDIGGGKTIRIHELHMEEDAGKLVHDPWIDQTRADYNRCGVPLIEIVTEPDFRTAEGDPAVSGGLRLQDAGGLPPLRCKPLHPPHGFRHHGHPNRDEEPELLQGRLPGHRL